MSYALSCDSIRLRSNDLRIVELADRLWDRTSGARDQTPGPIDLTLDVTTDPWVPPPAASEAPQEEWDVGPYHAHMRIGPHMHVRIACSAGSMEGEVSPALLASHPSLVVRQLLEAPAAMLLARRAYGMVHGGAVVGPGGAVVIRGAPGAGKSTLVAAAYCAGFGVLGDETVLVARSDPDDLLAAVRDVTLLADSTRMLALADDVAPASGGPSPKDRLDLSPSVTPAARRARRVATVLLGPRSGALRLEPLPAETFLREFEDGAIMQEQWSGTPPRIARHWSRRGAYRLSGTGDLAGAVRRLAAMVSHDLAPTVA